MARNVVYMIVEYSKFQRISVASKGLDITVYVLKLCSQILRTPSRPKRKLYVVGLGRTFQRPCPSSRGVNIVRKGLGADEVPDLTYRHT
jgi:hypothetical protein